MRATYQAALLALALLASSPASANETISYTYDELGRLIVLSASGTVNDGQNVNTTFDAAGNRNSYDVSGVGGGGTATISIGNASVIEGGTLQLTVTRSGVTTTAVSASYASASGTATSGSDFTAVSGTVNFIANDTSETINVSTTDDATVESAETMTVTLSNPSSGATIGTAVGTGTINDNDSGGGGSIIIPQSYSASSNYQSYTGLNGTGAGMRDAIYNTSSSIHGTNTGASEWIMMDLGSSQSVANVVVVPAAASAPGGWGAAYLNGAILERSTDSANWTTVATVSGASEGVLTQIAVNTSTRYLRLRMTNNYLGVGDFYATAGGGGGGPGTVSINNASVTEGGTLAFTVTRTGGTGAFSVNYATSSGTAVSPGDFTAIGTTTLSFGSSENSKPVNVTTIDDGSVESSETMSVTLSSPTNGATIGTGTGTGTINDNDSGGGGSIIVPQSYSASSNYNNYTGLSGTGAGMRDAVYNTSSGVHGTFGGSAEWIMMDLGSSQSVGNVVVVPIPSTFDSWGAAYTKVR